LAGGRVGRPVLLGEFFNGGERRSERRDGGAGSFTFKACPEGGGRGTLWGRKEGENYPRFFNRGHSLEQGKCSTWSAGRFKTGGEGEFLRKTWVD